jgi:glutathione S-transferase
VGDALTAADLYLVPQFERARVYGVDVGRYARLGRAVGAALATEHAAGAAPEAW